MVATAAGTVKGEFQPVLFSSSGPVVSNRIDINVVNNITGAGNGFDREIFEKIAVGQMAINALGCKPLWVLTAVYSILP